MDHPAVPAQPQAPAVRATPQPIVSATVAKKAPLPTHIRRPVSTKAPATVAKHRPAAPRVATPKHEADAANSGNSFIIWDSGPPKAGTAPKPAPTSAAKAPAPPAPAPAAQSAAPIATPAVPPAAAAASKPAITEQSSLYELTPYVALPPLPKVIYPGGERKNSQLTTEVIYVAPYSGQGPVRWSHEPPAPRDTSRQAHAFTSVTISPAIE